MISLLRGKLLHKSPTEIIVDVNGVGYSASISLSTFQALENVSGEINIFTHLYVREDTMQLFGFATELERAMFRMLISVSGIGPKMAQTILSGMNTEELRNAIFSSNVQSLTTIPGVGKKTAERLIVELRDKLGKVEAKDSFLTTPTAQSQHFSEAVLALTSLGYNRANAEQTVRAIIQNANGDTLSLEEVIKRALRNK
ncbi:MAG: Holliday junction branch migration protein RuvA [Ignavibacteriales bacterium]|nr:Holliday junction branch migration protein RuvA [Ignavibacteriales bacterium]